MSTLFDRLNQELEAFGKRAQAALDGGKSQIELLRVKRQRDTAAGHLGLLIYQRDRGKESDSARIDALMLRLDDLEGQIAALESEVSTAHEEARGPAAAPEAEASAPHAQTAAADTTTE